MISHHTTDPQDERFDVLDAEGRPTGLTKMRGEVHRDGDWHGALHIWVYGVDDDAGPYILVQRRSLTKDTAPGALDVAIGGHIRSGETLEETVREAEEEIGLRAELADLTRIGRRFVGGPLGNAIDNEVQEIYAVRSDAPLTSYRLHPEEVAGLLRCPIADMLRMEREEADAFEALELRQGTGDVRVVTVRRDEFIPRSDAYVERMLECVTLLLAGKRVEEFEIR